METDAHIKHGQNDIILVMIRVEINVGRIQEKDYFVLAGRIGEGVIEEIALDLSFVA